MSSTAVLFTTVFILLLVFLILLMFVISEERICSDTAERIQTWERISAAWTGAVDHKRSSVPLIAVIMETRQHPLLVPIIEKFIKILGEEVPIVFIHGIQNVAVVKEAFGERLTYWPLQRDVMDLMDYNIIFTRKALYEALWGDHVLVFQTDTYLFEQAAISWEHFQAYDYVAAPLRRSAHTMFKKALVGLLYQLQVQHNPSLAGGLSLRKRNFCIDLLTRRPYQLLEMDEDMYYSHFAQKDGRVPAEKEAVLFASQSEDSAEWVTAEVLEKTALPFGCHQGLSKQWNRNFCTEEEIQMVLKIEGVLKAVGRGGQMSKSVS